MVWAYKGNDELASAACAMARRRARPCRISPYIFMTDPNRVHNVLARLHHMPRGGTVIYRHFGAVNKESLGCDIMKIAKTRDLQVLIAADEDLAIKLGAHGMHLPQRDMAGAKPLRGRHPNWLLTGAMHDQDKLYDYPELDAIIYSKVFMRNKTPSDAMNAIQFPRSANKKKASVFALGGVNEDGVDALLMDDPCFAGIAGISAFARGGLFANNLCKDDAVAMEKIHVLCFSRGWPATDFAAHIDNEFDTVLGLKKDDNLCGFIILRKQEQQAEILTMAVDPSARGQGIGAALLEEGLHDMKRQGADIVFLDVAKDNASALSLYKNSGFIQCGMRAGYYRHANGRVDALLFQKHLR